MNQNSEKTSKNILILLNFFVSNMIIFFIFLLVSSTILFSIYFFSERKPYSSYDWSIQIDLNTEFFLRELQRSLTIDINIANEKLLRSLDINTHYIDTAGYFYQSQNSGLSFSTNILEQINRDNKIYPVVLVKEQIKNKFNYVYFNFLIRNFAIENNLLDSDNISTRYKFEDLDNRLVYSLSIDKTDLNLKDYANYLEDGIRDEIKEIVVKYINTFASFVIDSKNDTKKAYLDSKVDWVNYYEQKLIQKIDFLENQKKIASKIDSSKLAEISNRKDEEDYSSHYYLTEPLEVELQNLKRILENRNYEKYIPYFRIAEIYLKNLDDFETNIDKKVLAFTKLYDQYINIDLFFTSKDVFSQNNIYIYIFIIFLLNILFILFMLLYAFYKENKNLINQ